MAGTRDYLFSVTVDTLLPYLRRGLEDVVYEILDRRKVPDRTDLADLRREVADLRAQVAALTTELKALQGTTPPRRKGARVR